ncbi:MAG: hypothetical protein A4E65_02973 [Syntrophorhabdus sp. PtaU1.Bin153]|nr:MAG: hypothetical protein A4E65_02973 [Syntrophorhabdus sp. PtaU1.Bin153]
MLSVASMVCQCLRGFAFPKKCRGSVKILTVHFFASLRLQFLKAFLNLTTVKKFIDLYNCLIIFIIISQGAVLIITLRRREMA